MAGIFRPASAGDQSVDVFTSVGHWDDFCSQSQSPATQSSGPAADEQEQARGAAQLKRAEKQPEKQPSDFFLSGNPSAEISFLSGTPSSVCAANPVCIPSASPSSRPAVNLSGSPSARTGIKFHISHVGASILQPLDPVSAMAGRYSGGTTSQPVTVSATDIQLAAQHNVTELMCQRQSNLTRIRRTLARVLRWRCSKSVLRRSSASESRRSHHASNACRQMALSTSTTRPAMQPRSC